MLSVAISKSSDDHPNSIIDNQTTQFHALLLRLMEERMRHVALVIAAFCAFPTAVSAETVVYGLVGNDHIVTFDPASPGMITSNEPITGLAPGEVLTGIDIRPLDGLIYTVATDRNVYRLTPNASSYAATLMGAVQGFPPPGPPISVTGNNFGIDFAPFDRIRLVSDTDQNLRINPLNGGAAVDTAINDGLGGHPFDVIGIAYTDSAPGGTTGTLYLIDGVSSSLLRSLTLGIPGTVVKTNLAGDPFAPLGISLNSQSQVGFDILFSEGINSAFLSANDNFYTVDLTSGQATLVGGIGVTNVRGITLAAVPEPGSWALMILGFGGIALVMRRSRPTTFQQIA